jgi:spore germination protein GerM
MGRKRKKDSQNNVIGISVLLIILLVYLKCVCFPDFNPFQDIDWTKFKLPEKHKDIQVAQRSVVEDYSNIPEPAKENVVKDKFIEVFFTKSTKTGNVYVAVSRKKPKNISEIEYAMKVLLSGPSKSDIKKGLYSEIPSSTKLISVKETPMKVIVNLSSDFEYGGGGDSLYTRMYQLIKTVNKNTTKPVYLYIDNKQASVIGGEGLMLKQPLRGNSLDD